MEGFAARTACLLASMVIAILAERRLNLMSARAGDGVRIAFLVLAVGSIWQILDLLSGDAPLWSAVAERIGIALLMIEDWRRHREIGRDHGVIYGRRASDAHGMPIQMAETEG